MLAAVTAARSRRGRQFDPRVSNPAAVYGPGQAITRPAGCERLDFELEIAAAVGPDGALAGFMLMNDWSARDIQSREMTVGLAPAKGKDFATSIGPWLVTPDELPYDGEWLDLEAAVFVGDRPIEPGDVVTLEAMGLGTLRTPISGTPISG